MNMTYHFGKIDYNGTGRKINAVDIEIKLDEKEPGKPVFTACGNIWNHIHTDIYCGGQCLDTIAKYVHTPQFKKIYRFWKLYHLNNMNAGTPEQEQAIAAWETQGNKYSYDAACDYLKSIGLYEVEYNGKPYKYGHSWIYRAIPENDLNEIKKLCHLNK